MFEGKLSIVGIAGVGFFVLAFVANALAPMFIYKDLPEQTAEQVVNERVLAQLRNLQSRYPESFQKYVGEPSAQKCADLLRLGRQIYIGEGCWHCHSQFIRPVSNESKRWGSVSQTPEYQNELQRPVMFGTRRVGPDLSREGGRRSNDWHAVHFRDPASVVTGSPMPRYPWFFDDGKITSPNERGLAIITYVQWLGSWLPEYPYYEEASELIKE